MSVLAKLSRRVLYSLGIRRVVKVNRPSDVANLPWSGDRRADSGLFVAVDDYVCNRAKTAEDARKALELMVRHGMGLNLAITQADLLKWVTSSGPKAFPT